MVAQRKIARMVLIVAVAMFALILSFLLWAASQEAQEIGAPVSTATGGIPTQPVSTP